AARQDRVAEISFGWLSREEKRAGRDEAEVDDGAAADGARPACASADGERVAAPLAADCVADDAETGACAGADAKAAGAVLVSLIAISYQLSAVSYRPGNA